MQPMLEKVLSKVQKPARYTGGEWNTIQKEWRATDIKVAFAFPDVYEVGMSHLGLQILYHVVNQREDALMERVFVPWIDMEAMMREHHIPLYTLESKRPVQDFDILAFTLQYEMTFTNILTILDLAGLPLRAIEREQQFPLVIAGGPCGFNPEPLANFIDAFVIGEGEEVFGELIEAMQEVRGLSRGEQLHRLAQVQGVYVPSFYEISYDSQGKVNSFQQVEGISPYVMKRVLKHFDQAPFPSKTPVPSTSVVHDRVMVEVLRGCTRGCRFCQAGIIYRPAREKKTTTLLEQAEDLIRYTGYDEISLTSLSTADYSELKPLVTDLLGQVAPKGVNISLPSLRVDAFSVELAKEIQKVRRSTLTFAPEAGTQRMRDVINKGVTEENLMTAVEAAFQAGWQAIKLYFMIGLPGERDEDLDGIVDLALKVLQVGQKNKAGNGLKVTISVSSFVPKAHTVFQWEPQDTLEELKRKQAYLKDKLKKERRIVLHWHDPQTSMIEAVLAKGDRRLGPVIERAWQLGARFDGWSECFSYAVWQQAFQETGIKPREYAQRRFSYDDVLPWDHIVTGVKKKYLIKEHQRSLEAQTTADCRTGKCSGCGLCPTFEIKPELAGGEVSDASVWSML